MTCPRCQGFMVSDLFLDLAETQGMWMKAARCMNCGYVLDPVMEKNRQQAIVTPILMKDVSEMAYDHTRLSPSGEDPDAW